MLQRVRIKGVKLPRLYIAETPTDIHIAREKGIPFIRWTLGQDALIKLILRPTLEKLFPYVRWDSVFGPRKFMSNIKDVNGGGPKVEGIVDNIDDDDDIDDADDTTSTPTPTTTATTPQQNDDIDSEGVDMPSEERVFRGSGSKSSKAMLSLEEYVGDLNSSVDLEVLQSLHLMPAFIGDILDCVKLNIGNGMHWREGYNKRTAMLSGRFDASYQLPNLIILDVSGSIPRGISATMISLIDTLRTQVSADLIITSSTSKFYPMGSELPHPESIRKIFGYSNESSRFFNILTNNIQGKHYGHVISFGDRDEPYYDCYDCSNRYSLTGTKVDFVHHYFVPSFFYGAAATTEGPKTGYAKWCHMLLDKPKEEYNTKWCRVIKKDEE